MSIQMLEQYLNLTSDREQLVVANMANVDTPGYHTRDIDFQGAMRRVVNGSVSGDVTPVALQVAGLPERPDGNNVNLDREGLMLSEVQMQYQIGVQLLKGEFHDILTAINEGK